MAKTIVLIDEGFQDAELIYPYFRLREAGHDVDLVGHEKRRYTGKYGYGFEADKAASSIDMSDYDCIVIPGGWAPDHLRVKEDIVRIVKDAASQGKVIAAICHAPQLLVEADVLKGKTMTCYKAVRKDAENAGADVVDEEVVVDGKLVTSRTPSDLPAFMRETLKLL